MAGLFFSLLSAHRGKESVLGRWESFLKTKKCNKKTKKKNNFIHSSKISINRKKKHKRHNMCEKTQLNYPLSGLNNTKALAL